MKLNFPFITLLALTAAGVQAQNGSSLARDRTGSTPAGLKQRVDGMQGTLVKMHAVLDQMRLKATANPKDALAKTNIEMWDLMVTHLDQELKDLKVAMAEREQWEARRTALYKQADAKSQAEAQAAQKQSASSEPR